MDFQLIESGFGKKLEIISLSITGGPLKRLGELGLVPGTTISKISQAPLKGPIQIEVRGTRLVIGSGLAEKIQVREL